MKENKKEIIVGFLASLLFWLPLIAIVVYSGNKSNYEFCDKVDNDTIPKVCKLRYPILNADKIKKLKNENEELKDKVLELKYKLEDIKDIIEGVNDSDNWQPDPPEIDF